MLRFWQDYVSQGGRSHGVGTTQAIAASRSWPGGLVDVGKRYQMYAAGHNLGVVMRKLLGVGAPRSLQAEAEAGLAALLHRFRLLRRLVRAGKRIVVIVDETFGIAAAETRRRRIVAVPPCPALAL